MAILRVWPQSEARSTIWLRLLILICAFVLKASGSGWKPPEDPDLKPLDDGRCDLKRLEGPIESVTDWDTPFILTGAIDGWPAKERWQKQEFLHKFGEQTSRVQDPTETAQFGPDREGSHYQSEPRVKDIMSDTKELVFDQDPAGIAKKLQGDYSPPAIFAEFENPVVSIGGEGLGLPFHAHGATWIGLVFGKKRWFIYDPDGLPEDVYKASALRSVRSWYTAGGANESKAIQCTQEAGEILYLPKFWQHATINLGDVIGIGGQLNQVNMKDGELEHWVEKYPNSKVPGVLLATVLERKKRSQEAAAHLTKAMQAYPLDFELRTRIGKIIAENAGNGPESATELIEQGGKVLQKTCEDEVCDPLVQSSLYERLGGWLSNQPWVNEKGKRKGRGLLAKAVKLDPSNTAARHNFAYVSFQLQEVDKAMKHLRKVVALDPSHKGSRAALDALSQHPSQAGGSGRREL